MAKKQPNDYPEQRILRKSGKNSFLEVTIGSLGIDKIGIAFTHYEEGKKSTFETFHLDIFFAARLANDILSGRYAAIAKTYKDDPSKTYTSVWLPIMRGGVDKKTGQMTSRILSLKMGSKLPWILEYQSGPGERQPTGIVAPKFGNKPDIKLIFAMTDDDLKEVALAIKEAVTLWSMHKYSTVVRESFARAEAAEKEKEREASA